MPYYNTQWHKITYINTKYLTKKEAFFQGFQALFLIFNCQTPGHEAHRLIRICDIHGFIPALKVNTIVYIHIQHTLYYISDIFYI